MIYLKLLHKFLVNFVCGYTVMINKGVLYSVRVECQIVENLLATWIKER
jgi:hypothetical protein